VVGAGDPVVAESDEVQLFIAVTFALKHIIATDWVQ
jgi:hypothetical protein